MKVFIIIVAILIVLILQAVLEKKARGTVIADIYPDTDASEPHGEIRLILRLENTSRIPRPFVRFTVLLPNDMHVISDMNVQSAPPDSVKIQGTVFMWPKKVIEKEILVSIDKRGYYRFGSLVLETGDFLGLKEHRDDMTLFRSVSVYPEKSRDTELTDAVGGILGDYSVRRFIFEDPVLITGFREYTGREPMKAISWTHSARSGQLMVRELDHTAQMSLSVVLNTDGADNAEAEACFSLARAVLEQLNSRNIEYDFFMNTAIGGSGSGQHYFAKGMGERHFYGVLLQLANAFNAVSFSAEELARRVSQNTGNVTGIIFITPGDDERSETIAAVLSGGSSRTVSCLYARDFMEEVS